MHFSAILVVKLLKLVPLSVVQKMVKSMTMSFVHPKFLYFPDPAKQINVIHSGSRQSGVNVHPHVVKVSNHELYYVVNSMAKP